MFPLGKRQRHRRKCRDHIFVNVYTSISKVHGYWTLTTYISHFKLNEWEIFKCESCFFEVKAFYLNWKHDALLYIISFRINSSTGEISTTEALDYETFHSHLLIAQAEDQGVPQSRRTAVEVSINVIDVNDNAPKFFEAQPDLNTVENNLFCPTYNTTVCTCLMFF